jgi:hypothetical protein
MICQSNDVEISLYFFPQFQVNTARTHLPVQGFGVIGTYLLLIFGISATVPRDAVYCGVLVHLSVHELEVIWNYLWHFLYNDN